ncbi:MAG: metalloregulator ArsR/SmtB family transcription factor [Gemmatimonadales bacterium]|jgi:ArsR family transcriptional regulator|nr:metalloregulator ArsR/SmtB family transcription factor [Gemmatimonadales bacterium]
MIQLNDANAGLVAERFRALGEPMRLRLLNALKDGERSVGELVDEIDAGQANVSKHLQLLHQMGFVQRRKEGTTAYYRIADPNVFKLCELVCGGMRDDLEEKRRLLRPIR